MKKKTKDPRTMIHILPFYLERLNKIAEAQERSQKVTLEVLIDLSYESLAEDGLIKEK